MRRRSRPARAKAGRDAAKSAVPRSADIAGIEASLLLLKWMAGFTLAFVAAVAWRMSG